MRKIFTFLFAALMSAGMYATTYTVTFTNLNSVVKVVENITLPHTFSCDYTNGNGELDLIIQESYNDTGHCDNSRSPWGGNDNEVVVGQDGNNHFVTINAPFVGTSFMSGYYDGSSFGNFYYSFHITIAAAEPEPLFEISYEDKWLKVNPTGGEGQYFVFVEDKEYYDNRYIQYDQTTMQNYLDYVVGVVVGMSAQSNFVFSGEKDIDPDPIYHTWYDNDHLLINHDYVAFVFKFENDARVGDVEYLAFTYAGEPEQEEGIEHIVLTEKAKKVVVDGMVYIVRDGKLFNLTGAQVR